MTELHFPGGPVAIDEGRVWARVSEWLGEGMRDRELSAWRGQGGRLVVCLRDGHTCHIGRSTLGLPDAAAQALQIAENAE